MTFLIGQRPKAGVGVRWSFESLGMGDGEPDPRENAAADMGLAKMVHDKLMSWFFHPGWRTEASYVQGIVKFNIPELMGESNWMVIRIPDLERSAPGLKIIRDKAGELLERYKIPRETRLSEADFIAAIARHPLGYLGGGSRMIVPN